MKHAHKVVLVLVALFLVAQYIGIAIINNSETLPYDIDRPAFSEEYGFLQLFGYIVVATLVAMFMAFFWFEKLWKALYFFSVFFCLTIAFGAFMPDQSALAIAFLFSLGKLFRLNVILHNFTELFIYGGLAAIFVPEFNLLGAALLLVLISIYDAYAVWKSGHMIKLAKFQTKVKVFAGLLVPYKKNRTAILGGGDIGFPLIFTGVAYASMGASALVIPVFSALALYLLLIKGRKDRFYPAMPFITAGVFVGYLIAALL